MNLPTITDLYHKEEMLEKLGNILRGLTLSNGQKPFSRLNEATFKSERKINISEITIICPSENGEIIIKCQREVQRNPGERLVYSNWQILSQKDQNELQQLLITM